MTKLNNKEVTVADGDKNITSELSDKDILKRKTPTLAHGNGHNIGLQHSDEGIMEHQCKLYKNVEEVKEEFKKEAANSDF